METSSAPINNGYKAHTRIAHPASTSLGSQGTFWGSNNIQEPAVYGRGDPFPSSERLLYHLSYLSAVSEVFCPDPIGEHRSLNYGGWVGVDFIGPLPEAGSGYRYMLSIFDFYSRFAIGLPTKEPSSIYVIVGMEYSHRLLGMYPNRVLVDNAGAFTSFRFCNWC